MELTQGKKKKSPSIISEIFVFPVAPRRQYRRLVYICLAVLVLSVAAHEYVLYRIRDHQLFFANSSTVEPLPSVDDAKLQTVLTQYDAKASREQAGQTAEPVVLQPNL